MGKDRSIEHWRRWFGGAPVDLREEILGWIPTSVADYQSLKSTLQNSAVSFSSLLVPSSGLEGKHTGQRGLRSTVCRRIPARRKSTTSIAPSVSSDLTPISDFSIS